jgi:tetratricopeptide (TPR) repeat protein
MEERPVSPRRDIRSAEAAYHAQPALNTLVDLLDAYLDRAEPRTLELALTLVLRNLDGHGQEGRFLDRASELLVRIKGNPQAISLAGELARRMVQSEPEDAWSYVNASYVQWAIGNIDAAIELADSGLAGLPPAVQHTPGWFQLKDNLAYYYAERGRPQDGNAAHQHAQEAHDSENTASRADTLGYVLTKFSRGVNDLVRAKELLDDAKRRLSTAGTTTQTVQEHLDIVAEKLKEIEI